MLIYACFNLRDWKIPNGILKSQKSPLAETTKSVAIVLNLAEYNIDLEEVGTGGQRARRPDQWVSLRAGPEVLRRPGEHRALRVARRHHQVANLPENQSL